MKAHWQLRILLFTFIAPAIVAGYMLLFTDTNNFNTVQHGDLVVPALRFTDANITANKWNVLYSPNIDSLQMQNLHVALGANTSRVAVDHFANANGIMIIDPQGMYIMHYPLPINMSGVLKDLRRLLKYSHAK